MWNRIICVFCLFLSTNVIAITAEEFSAKLMQTHPFFLQLSLSEKVSLIDQKIARTYTDWNIQMGANESFMQVMTSLLDSITIFIPQVTRFLLLEKFLIQELI